MNNDVATVTVEFVTDQVKVTRDIEGNVVDGDPDRIETPPIFGRSVVT